MRSRGFRLDHPLFDELGKQPVVAFRAAFDQLLERAQFAQLALQDDVALNMRHDPVHNAARLRLGERAGDYRARNSCGHEPHENAYRAPHQNVVPRLKKN